MLVKLKNLFSRLSFKLLFLVILIMASLLFKGGHFIFVKAYNNQINIVPGEFTVEQDESDMALGLKWQNIGNAFYQDLSAQSAFAQFNKDNSAFIFSINYPDNFNNQSSGSSGGSSPGLEEQQNQSENQETTNQNNNNTEEINEPIINQNNENEQPNEIENPASEESGQAETVAPIDFGTSQPADETESSINPVDLPPSDSTITPDTGASEESSRLILKRLILNLKNYFARSNYFEIFNFKLAKAEENNGQDVKNFIKQSIIFSDFSVPLAYKENGIGNIELRLSLAAMSQWEDDNLLVEYNSGFDWQQLGAISLKDEISNQQNGDYFRLALPADINWDNIENLKIKISYDNKNLENGQLKQLAVYLDAIWLEVEYNDGSSEELLETAEKENGEEINMQFINSKNIYFTSSRQNFKSFETPSLNFKFNKNKNIISRILSDIVSLVYDEYKDININVRTIKDGNLLKLPKEPEIKYLKNGEFTVDMPGSLAGFKPGKYTLAVEVKEGEEIFNYYQDFYWGVLAINTNKSIYLPDEKAYLQMAVLDDYGHTLCNADLNLEIKSPDGQVKILSTGDNSIIKNPECGPDNIIDKPDYYAYYHTGEVGYYGLKLTAITENGSKEILDQFEVKNSLPFELERIGPTRIYPLANYEMKLKVKSNIDFQGELKEYIPNLFDVIVSGTSTHNHILEKNLREIVWPVDFKSGQTYEFSYLFDAPDVSPEFYLLGRVIIGDWEEGRNWQIASDAVFTYVGNAQSNINWTNPDNAVDSTDDTYARKSIPAKSRDDSANYLQATANDSSAVDATISKVEIGVEGYVQRTNTDVLIIPRFGGTTNGSTYTITGVLLTTTDTDATFYQDVTSDAAGPGALNWAWSDIADLDVRLYGINSFNAARNLYIDQIRIRVTTGNLKPSGSFNSVAQKADGSGIVDFSIEINDGDLSTTTRAKIEYTNNASCNFTLTEDPVLSESTSTITADFGSPRIDNNYAYQVGTSTGWITTASGSNSVAFQWPTLSYLPTAEGVYCARLTANDTIIDQATPATSTFIVDNKVPTAPGQLTATSSGNKVTLIFGTQSTDGYFKEYKIFYKIGSSGVTEGDSVHSSSTDANLGYANFLTATTTRITGLQPNTQYVFNIWAYDQYGNKASSSGETTVTTGEAIRSRVNSVTFPAGAYSANGTTGQNSDTNNSLSTFNFKLGEADASIQKAFIVADFRYEAFTNGGAYTGYDLAFDACQEPCTADAFSGTNRVLTTNADALAYSETESNEVRLIYDVTNETQLKNYVGGSTNMQGQVGYNIKRGGATNSIALAKAYLVVTYVYDHDLSTSLTNTVIYPLESASAGDSGSRLAVQSDDCAVDSNCPLFNYNMEIPEFGQNLAQWYEINTVNDTHSGRDYNINVNIESINYDSMTYVHETANGGTQSNSSPFSFVSVTGFSANTAQVLEIHPYCPAANGDYYVLGGETFATYSASSSAVTKTKTVSYPIGVINNGYTTTKNSGSIDVYFPENGAATGTVSVKKAWLRITTNNYVSAADTIGVTTKVGDRAETATSSYAYNPGVSNVRPAFTIFHVIPSSDYIELESANASVSKTVALYTLNNSAAQGVTSAELMITYTYSSQNSGYLATIRLSAGESASAATSSTINSAFSTILPEVEGTKYIRGAGLLASYAISDPDSAVLAADLTIDANISTSTPVCTNTYYSRPDATNAFTEFIKSVRTAVTTTDNQSYNSCYSINQATNANCSAKANGIITYTYQWTAPPPKFTQNDWRWYENANNISPTTAKAVQNATTTNINLADAIRLRMNILVTEVNMPANYQAFKLQYATGTNCTSISGWTDVEGLAGSGAWIGYDNSLVSDGATDSAVLLASSTDFESYEETNPSVSNQQALLVNEQGEWDWVLYNNAASPDTSYCFQMAKSDGSILDYFNSDSYPVLTTAPANSAPNNPASLKQYWNNGAAQINNGTWINEDSLKLTAGATDVNINEVLNLYFEFIPATSTFTTSTAKPAGACADGTAYTLCPGLIWISATSSVGDYRISPFYSTTTLTAIPDNASGYKWQVLACDDSDTCSGWVKLGSSPNVKVDITPPTPPGDLTFASSTATSITLELHATTTEENFLAYRIFYKAGSSGVTEYDIEHDDPDFDNIYYNYTSTTTAINLAAGTQFVFNIWAYDQAGNKATATTELVASTLSSFTPPTGSIYLLSQQTDGTGSIKIVMKVDDEDNDDTLRAKIMYNSGTGCDFSSYFDPTIDPAVGRTTDSYSSYPDPVVDNDFSFQVGTTSGWIITSPGENYIETYWLSKTEIPETEGTYCIGLVVNDGSYSAATSSATVFIDNVSPTAPGPLTLNQKNSSSITLNFGSDSYDARFSRYRIFYSTSTPVTESDYEHADSHLNFSDYGDFATTTVSGLASGTLYYFNIWAYDTYGNKASSTIFATSTNSNPYNLSVIGQYKNNETAALGNGSWTNEDTVKLSAQVYDNDTSEWPTLYFQFITATGTYLTATSEPANACVYGTSYSTCTSTVWFVSSTSPGYYGSAPYLATSSITGIPNSASGYKWQVLACDDDHDCTANWVKFDLTAPNVKVDYTFPTAPGQLTENTKTSSSITLNFGATTTESNFKEYKIYYATSSPVTESSSIHSSSTDSNLASITFNSVGTTTVTKLIPNTAYYFSIWAYDLAGNAASSTTVSITTSPVASTPGVLFYSKNTQVIYYNVWSGTSWGGEQAGPTLGAAGDNIQHIEALRSDNGSLIGLLIKTYSGTNQKWWGTVYRVAANDFTSSSQLGANYASANNVQLITGCIGSLSGNEFFVVRNNNRADGTLVYSWSAADNWTTEAAGPNPVAILNGCRLVRRPGTDNYLLMTFDDDSDVGSAYYYGGSAYANDWTVWLEHSTSEDDANNYVGEGFFDPSDNTQGAINYSNSATNDYTYAKKFIVTNNTISFGTASTSPQNAPENWGGDFVHGEFAVNPAGAGTVYYSGRDVNNELNIYKINTTGSSPAWSTVTNGDNISGGNLYEEGNYSQKPFSAIFYKDNAGVALWDNNAAAFPQYRQLDASADSVSASDTAVPGADSNIWPRVKTYKDPNENEFIAVYQNDDVDYAAVFWDGVNNRFYNTTDNPGSNQVWNELATAATAVNGQYQRASFAFSAGNSTPNPPTSLVQYKSNASTLLANGSTTNETTIILTAQATDPDTSEQLKVYLQLIANNDTFATSTSEPASPCASTTSFSACPGKIWLVASSSVADYSVAPLHATATITSLAPSSIGYKWQVMVCDDGVKCSSWTYYNATAPNFYVDTTNPTAPGNLTITSKTSTSVTLTFGASTTEENFLTYRIYYKAGSAGVTESDFQHTDADLAYKDYNGTTNTVVINLASSTQYVFNIWAYDRAGNKASATPVSTTTNERPRIRQSSYILESDNGVNVNANSHEVNASTTLTDVNKGERINVRIQIENYGGDSMTNKIYKLQFENQTDTPGTWTDVGAATAMSYSLGISGNSGDIISTSTAVANVKTWANGYWYENTNQTGSYTLENNKYTEFVFMVKTNNATLGKIYRFRLVNLTDTSLLDDYSNYPTISMVSFETKRYSKESLASLPSGISDLTYFFDPYGYTAINIDDGIRDAATSTGSFPIFLFAVKNASNTDSMIVNWNGQSTASSSVNNVVLQVYNSSTTAWTTVATHSTSSVDTDFYMSGYINSSLSQYYGANNWTYWRVYQASGSQNLKSDYFKITFASSTPSTSQLHYRWRDDNGDETTAAWREAEDTGDPSGSTVSLNPDENVRIRFSVGNLGAGLASGYIYRIEYATSTGSCTAGIGAWTTIPSNDTGHWRTASSTGYANGDSTTAQFSNSESYTFTAGRMVEDPSATTSAISLSENQYTEIEYAIKATANANTAGTYCFRVTNNGSELDIYDNYPVITLAGNTNIAPEFTVFPSDNGSGSSSPTDYGDPVIFTAYGRDNDPADSSLYLAICKTNSITAGNDGPPTCNGGSWCVSDLTSTTTELTCQYTTATSSEVLPWYGFVCDKHAGFSIAKCSAMSQGSGDAENDSPFLINHPPLFTSATTSINFQDPGGTFRISTVSSDSDNALGQNTLSLFVCRTNFSTYSGCGGAATNTVCSVTGALSDAYCDYADTAPTPAGDNTYYAFVYDNWGMMAAASPISGTYTINNVEPSIGTLVLNNGNDISLLIKPSSTTVVTIATTTDQNGCDTGLVSANAVVYITDATSSYNCVADDNYCYQITTSNCVKSGCTDDNDPSATYTCTTHLKYFAAPTDDSLNNPDEPQKWQSYIRIYDGSNYASTISAGVEVITTLALDVNESLIDFGDQMFIGENTGTRNSTSTIENLGNSPINTDLSGTNMTGTPSGTINVNYIKWHLANFNYPSSGYQLTLTATSVDIAAPKPTSDSDVKDEIYWGIAIPYGADSSIYNGTNNFTVKIDGNNWW